MNNEKLCRPCGEVKPLDSFRHRSGKSAHLLHSQCRACDARYARERNVNASYRWYPPGTSPQHKRKVSKLRNRYGLTIEQYNDMLTQQNNCCKVCDKGLTSDCRDNIPHVDHCHTTGMVRGILCGNCNKALGMVKDNTHILERMVLYLNGRA